MVSRNNMEWGSVRKEEKKSITNYHLIYVFSKCQSPFHDANENDRLCDDWNKWWLVCMWCFWFNGFVTDCNN